MGKEAVLWTPNYNAHAVMPVIDCDTERETVNERKRAKEREREREREGKTKHAREEESVVCV